PDVASLLDALVVLRDVDANGPDPFAWSPLPIDRAEEVGALDQWLAIGGDGPQRVILPAMHTLAERGGKPPRRRGVVLPGSELFFASCSLMSAGAETVLLSRWRVGGQSTLDVVREFIQELPHTAAAEAWQRSVALLREAPIDPANELRVKPGKEPVELTAAHPFFWAGYLVVDSGWRPVDDGAPGEAGAEPAVGPADAGGAVPAPEPQPPAGGLPAGPAAGAPAGGRTPPPNPTPPNSPPPNPTAPPGTPLPGAAPAPAPAQP
ncbi:MAG TPA: CHAT domain-containing protein, partial [Lacipirellulaceae bacterium]|nr:CHAT domain-containing protein [Lacipirellulaceae bacterium]